MKEFSDYVFERDRHEFSVADTLDIKTGLILASLTFLAIQSGEFIKPGLFHLPIEQRAAQGLSLLAMAVSGIFCAVELWPRDYDREAMPETWERWIAEMRAYRTNYPDAAAESIEEDLRSARLDAAKERIAKNSTLNEAKSNRMFVAFYFAAGAFALSLATLVMRLF
jgi:hypothetical protein